jgi:hypothetical protein
MASASASSITFPKKLTAIRGQPTNATLHVLYDELYQNAMAIPALSGGPHGHLGLLLTEVDYRAINDDQPYVPPVHPGPTVVHVANPTAAQIAEDNRIYAARLADYERYRLVENELKKQLFDAVDEMYFVPVKETPGGYSRVPLSTLVAHLRRTYSALSDQERINNRAMLSSDWDPTTPIETLFERIRECQRVALVDEDPIHDTVAIRDTVNMFARLQLFPLEVRVWRMRPPHERRMTDFQDFFRAALVERNSHLTTADAGYHSANTVAALTATPPRTTTTTKTVTPANEYGKVFYYCWTHGFGTNPAHTSASCKMQKPGHQANATFQNMMGGCCQLIRRQSTNKKRTDAPAPAAANTTTTTETTAPADTA